MMDGIMKTDEYRAVSKLAVAILRIGTPFLLLLLLHTYNQDQGLNEERDARLLKKIGENADLIAGVDDDVEKVRDNLNAIAVAIGKNEVRLDTADQLLDRYDVRIRSLELERN